MKGCGLSAAKANLRSGRKPVPTTVDAKAMSAAASRSLKRLEKSRPRHRKNKFFLSGGAPCFFNDPQYREVWP